MKKKPNQGFIKELAKEPVKPLQDNKYSYPKPVVRPQEIKSYAMNSRAKSLKAVKPDKSTDFTKEQTQALKTHKGIK